MVRQETLPCFLSSGKIYVIYQSTFILETLFQLDYHQNLSKVWKRYDFFKTMYYYTAVSTTNDQWRSQSDILVRYVNFKLLSLFISLEIDCFQSQ